MLIFIILCCVFRIAMLVVSRRHEVALKARGSVEFGAMNSSLLAISHVLFYAAAAVEGLREGVRFDDLSLAGVLIYLVSAAMLLKVVSLLGAVWTVKIIIAPDHRVVRHPLFRIVRHPNYFLNILPELVGYALTLHAFRTLAIGLPIYLVPLAIRVTQENRAMHEAGLIL